jgi:hypothetical protein
MEWIENEDFKAVATEYQYQMIILLKESLSEQGIKGKKAEDICGNFAFSLGILHDQGEVKTEGQQYLVKTVFQKGPKEVLAGSEYFSWHEYAFGNASEAFE